MFKLLPLEDFAWERETEDVRLPEEEEEVGVTGGAKESKGLRSSALVEDTGAFGVVCRQAGLSGRDMVHGWGVSFTFVDTADECLGAWKGIWEQAE